MGVVVNVITLRWLVCYIISTHQNQHMLARLKTKTSNGKDNLVNLCGSFEPDNCLIRWTPSLSGDIWRPAVL